MSLQIQGASVVLRGDFNPAIFHPAWFAAYELLRREEADAAKVEVVHRDAAIFSTEWLNFNSLRDRLQIATTQEAYYEALRDLVTSILSLLSHTPIKFIGINREFHYALESVSAWHNVGYQLVPKQYWENILKDPGMRSLTVQGKRPDDLVGFIQVKVEPSIRIEHGVYVHINDHYVLNEQSTGSGASEAMRILTECWDGSMKRSLSIADTISHTGSRE